MSDILHFIFVAIGAISLGYSVVIEDDRWFRINVIVILFYIVVNQ
ncbi:MAG: hypothetical protein AABY22_35530 [Nanoarchaeota archaeon]